MCSSAVPSVSILLAVRNEAWQLAACLDSLLAQQAPEGGFELLIGDDASEDGTGALARAYAQADGRVRVFALQADRRGNLRGKAGVLHALACQARAPFLLCTDADMRLPQGWLMGMWQAAQQERLGIVTGVTLVQGRGRWAGWQRLEWLHALAGLHLLDRMGIGLTAMGNNMLVRRQAYEQVGGYAAIPFSVAEDFALHRALKAHGWKGTQLLSRQVLGWTQDVPSLGGWIAQRHRWMRGAMALPQPWPILLSGYFLLPIALLLSGLLGYPSGWWGLGVLWIIRGALLGWAAFRLEVRSPWISWAGMGPLLDVLYAFLFFYRLFPIKVQWKGRVYA